MDDNDAGTKYCCQDYWRLFSFREDFNATFQLTLKRMKIDYYYPSFEGCKMSEFMTVCRSIDLKFSCRYTWIDSKPYSG